MEQALHIFRKDVRRLWPYAAVATLLLAVFTVGSASSGLNRIWYDQTGELMMVALPVAWWILIAMLVHEECLPGDRQFWLTRPYRRASLLGAKCLFCAVFIALPLWVSGAVILGLGGFSPLDHAGNLLWSQVLAALYFVIPGLALAAITRTLSQFALTVVGFLVIQVVVAQMRFAASGQLDYWSGFTWVRTWAGLLCATGAALSVIGIQYFLRRPALALSIGVAGVAATLLALSWAPWDTAFAMQQRLSRRTVSDSEVRVGPDASRGRLLEAHSYRALGTVDIAVPIRFEHASTVAVEAQRIDLGIPSAGLARLVAPNRMPPPRLAWDPNERAYRLRFSLDIGLYSKISRAPVDLAVTAYLNIFGNPKEVRIPAGQRDAAAPGLGRCSFRHDPPTFFGCYAPFRPPDRVITKVEHRTTGQRSEWARGSDDTFSPWPHDSPLSPVVGPFPVFAGRMANFDLAKLAESDIIFETWDREGHLKKEFTLPNVRLSDFEVTVTP